MHLLNHILSLVIEPNDKQHSDIKKLQLNVKKLEECTNEALSGFYAESPTNASKKQFLNEIFKVARQQERFKNGEIGKSGTNYAGVGLTQKQTAPWRCMSWTATEAWTTSLRRTTAAHFQEKMKKTHLHPHDPTTHKGSSIRRDRAQQRTHPASSSTTFQCAAASNRHLFYRTWELSTASLSAAICL